MSASDFDEAYTYYLRGRQFSQAWTKSNLLLIGAKDGTKDISPEHLRGKTIGVQVSTIHQNYAKKYYGDGSIIKTYQTQDEADQDLAAGRLDYVQDDAVTVGAFLQTEAGRACCELKGTVRDDPEILGQGAAGGVRKEDTALKARLNAAIKAVRASGEYAAISAKYFNFDIYRD